MSSNSTGTLTTVTRLFDRSVPNRADSGNFLEAGMSVCRICQGPCWGAFCDFCLKRLNPSAYRRRLDTQHARRVARDADAYERAREADEAEAPPKHRVEHAPKDESL